MISTWLILCLFADIFYLVSCNCNTNCSEIVCAKGDDPICHVSKCVCKRHTGVCFSDAECGYGEHCDHPMCDTSSHQCHCGHLPRHHHHCSSDPDCTSSSSHCSSGVHSRCYHGYCYCLEKFSVGECGHHHHHHDEECHHHSCPSSYSEICSSNKCGCIRDSVECLEDSHCAHHGCHGNGKPTCENNGCVCIDKVSVTCNAGWIKLGENCYRKYGHQADWIHAMKDCKGNGGALVDIGSHEEQSFVQKMAGGNDVWIAGSDSSEEGKWRWFGSGQTWGYTNWNKGQPDNFKDQEDCAVMTSGGHWNDTNCNEHRLYICEQTTAKHQCTSPWIERNGACFKLFTDKASWSDALETCQLHSATLVYLENSQENEFVHGLTGGKDIWIGGNDGQRDRTWSWVGTNLVWGYSKWDSGEPDNRLDEDCIAMIANGTWHDTFCNTKTQLEFVCKRKLPPINGGWSQFGHYAACSVSCGGGATTRSRTCSNPAPKWGGEDCSGSSTQTSSCNTNPCPVDGSWSAWGAWGHCSKTCGGGTRERHRTCTNPAPSHGGANCIGSLTVTESCNTQHCPIAGSWSAWGAWGKCSVTCGRGTHERHRTCSNPAPNHGGADCVGSSTLTQHCESVQCPIDGSWSAWGAWGQCSVTCGGGTKERHRTCSNPVPSHGGANCVGSYKNSHNCNDASCPTASPGVPCPVCDPSMNCVWGNECPDGQTCMIRSYPHYNFTVHCSIKDDCHFIKAVTTSGEIYCCDDRQCLRNILGL